MAEIDISSMERPDTGILPGELLAAKSEKPCPECGEKVRQGLVRCWNCGAFMNRALEAKFQEMQSKPREIMLSAVPEGEAVDASGQAEDDDDDDDEAYTLAGPSLDLGPQPNAPITSIPSIPRPTPAAPKVPTPASSTPSFTAVDNAPKLELKPLVKEGEKPPEKPVDKDAPETDALLSIALKDEAELAERRKRRPVRQRAGRRPVCRVHRSRRRQVRRPADGGVDHPEAPGALGGSVGGGVGPGWAHVRASTSEACHRHSSRGRFGTHRGLVAVDAHSTPRERGMVGPR